MCVLLNHVQLFAIPWTCSLPNSSAHGIFQARIQEWVAIPFSRGSSWPRDRTPVFCIASRVFTVWAIREASKGPYGQSYGFSSSHVWMWELDHNESWALKNGCFWTWCWRRLLRFPWTARRSNQSFLKEISPEYSLEGLMLKHQYFGHLMRRADSLEETLMLEKIESRRRGQQRMRWLNSITD